MEYFTIDELSRSDKARRLGIRNVPGDAEKENLKSLVENVLDPCREKYGHEVYVSSGYRCPVVNKAVGGASSSQHVRGEAADIYSKGGQYENYVLGKIIVSNGNFDQIIFENVGQKGLIPRWIHVSWKRNGQNRHEILKKVIGSNSYIRISKDDVL